MCIVSFRVLFCNHTVTTEIYTLSLHDALPIFINGVLPGEDVLRDALHRLDAHRKQPAFLFLGTVDTHGPWNRNAGCFRDRKSTRLNSSHSSISYAVFCLKKKKNKLPINLQRHQ